MGLGGFPNAVSRPEDGPTRRLYDGPGLSDAGGVDMDPTIGSFGAGWVLRVGSFGSGRDLAKNYG